MISKFIGAMVAVAAVVVVVFSVHTPTISILGHRASLRQMLQSQAQSPDLNAAWPAVGAYFATLLCKAENDFNASHGAYASDVDLSSGGALAPVVKALTDKFGIGVMHDLHWTFHINPNPLPKQEGSGYLLSVRNASGGKCDPVFFADETGSVYQGKAPSCQ